MQIAFWTMIVVAVGWIFKKLKKTPQKKIENIHNSYFEKYHELQRQDPPVSREKKDIMRELNRFKEQN